MTTPIICANCGHAASNHDTASELECCGGGLTGCACRHTELEVTLRTDAASANNQYRQEREHLHDKIDLLKEGIVTALNELDRGKSEDATATLEWAIQQLSRPTP